MLGESEEDESQGEQGERHLNLQERKEKQKHRELKDTKLRLQQNYQEETHHECCVHGEPPKAPVAAERIRNQNRSVSPRR